MNKKIVLNLKAHNPEDRAKISEAVQQVAFKLGFEWGATGKTVSYTDSEAICFGVSGETKRLTRCQKFDKEDYQTQAPKSIIYNGGVPEDAITFFLALMLLDLLSKSSQKTDDVDDEVIQETIEGVNVEYCKHGCSLDPTELLNRVEAEAKRRASEKFGIKYV